MATSYFSVLLSVSVTSFLLLLPKVHSAEAVSFAFSGFDPSPGQKNLILQGDALVTATGQLQLTAVENGVPLYYSHGRALYSNRIHIWDSDTQAVASFVSTFSFVISAPNKAKTADGLAFFLAPEDTQPQEPGGYLGIFRHDEEIQTVAVEFDTYHNPWDPKNPHIGIDVNHITSTKTAAWDFSNGDVANVAVIYNGPTNSLTVSLVYPSSRTSYILNEKVDLKKYLPEWVRIGFSATSGLTKDYVESHDVLSWTFNSELPDSSSGAFKENMHLSSYVLRE